MSDVEENTIQTPEGNTVETEVSQTENITDKNPNKEMSETSPNVEMSTFDSRIGTLQNQLDDTNNQLFNLATEFSNLATRLNLVETVADEVVTPVSVATAIGAFTNG